MKKSECAKWIWLPECEADSYGEFYKSFLWERGNAICRLSCDGDYTLYINGKYVSSWQYGDFEHYKIYDEMDITPYLQNGENHLAVLVWYYGANSQRYIAAQAGLLFEVLQGDKILASSDETVLCRKSPCFISGKQKWITSQMGFSFAYDATKEDDWKNGNISGGQSAVLVKKDCDIVKRPIDKNLLMPPAESNCLIAQGNYYLFDLEQETVGIPCLSFISDCEQDLMIQWGEDLQNGHVRRIIGERDFSFQYRAKAGKNDFTNYMLRMGCRYIEVFAENPIEVEYAGICATPYPAEKAEVKLESPLDQRIYDTCVRTLQLCMMDRYVDTPWREQCLYVFDARNQMLCGYYAFYGGNAKFARAALKLISQDHREDGLLAITYPCGMDLTIPSFSLHYFRAIREYGEHIGDWSLAEEVYPKLQSILDTFVAQIKNDLVCKFAGTNHWNFYDWSDYLEGRIFESEEPVPDLILNCLFVIACQDLGTISQKIGKAVPELNDLIAKTRQAVKKAFYHGENGLFSMTEGGSEFTVLGNALAILAGIVDAQHAKDICKRFGNGEMTDCTLSMKCFQYDAMLQNDKSFAHNVLTEIRTVYGEMLEQGATSVWETAEGAAAFDNAGSLCHGWSAIPVYYYSILQKEKGV